MSTTPPILRRARCPRCRSTNVPVTSTHEGGVQYRRCGWCDHRFKTVIEPPQPEGIVDNGQADGDPETGAPQAPRSDPGDDQPAPAP